MPTMIFGRVSSTGTAAHAGSGGWTSGRVPDSVKGKYLVQFSPALESRPIVIVSCYEDDSNTIATMDASDSYFVVHTKQAGTLEDSAFDFLAIYPSD